MFCNGLKLDNEVFKQCKMNLRILQFILFFTIIELFSYQYIKNLFN